VVTLNEAKTSIREARKESFNFLGYTLGPHRFRKDGHWYLGASPSKKAVDRLKQGLGELLVPGNKGTWAKVRERLNRKLRGVVGVSGGRQLCLSRRAEVPAETSQGAVAWHPPLQR
jgi:RNA-directed DNA polymerase